MKKLAIIGSPLAHSVSPVIYNAAFAVMGIDANYEAWPTPVGAVDAALERLRGAEMMGMNVTVPHKELVLSLLDDVDSSALAIGAVNCIVKADERLVGYNTDKSGFIDSIRQAGFDPAGTDALVLGAGGSARAVCFGLAEAGAANISVAGRTPKKTQNLVADLSANRWQQANFEGVAWQDDAFFIACRHADLVVNCTPVGMRHTDAEQDSPMPAESLTPNLWICDLVYNPRETVLVQDARKAGAHVVGGLEMLVLQAVESIRLWTGQEPPVDIMRKAALDALRENE